jgi:hypothetical protein
LDLTRKLRFEERPNYKAYRKMFMDLYAREGYMEDDTFDWTITRASKSGELTSSAAGQLAKVFGAKRKPLAAKPKIRDKPKMTPEGGIAEVVRGVDLVITSHEERQATQARTGANKPLGPVKSGLVAKERVASKAKVVPEKVRQTTNELDSKPRPKVLNKIVIATQPIPALASSQAKPLLVEPAPVKPLPQLVAKVEPKAKLTPKPNLPDTEKIPIYHSSTFSTPSSQPDVDRVLEKMGDLRISDRRPSTQIGTDTADLRHVCKGTRRVLAQKYSPSPPRPQQPGRKKAAPKTQPTKYLPVMKEAPSPEIVGLSSDSDDAKPIKADPVPARRIPLRTRNINSKPVTLLVHSSPQRRKNPPRLANVTTNAKSPPRRRVIVTRAVAGRKER